ncbi:conjugal transfer protein TraG N-terminal domain-containing protein (plasmid) [Shewanella sp. HL-SH4]|uniref:conjugal transfer protein TraG N-terminal domain-containing protein n=1 Tax=Shewanella sp. HL-SH4 TaxID=3436240 RepID=UPI003EBA1932
MTGFEVYSMGNPEFLIEIFKGLSRMWSQNDIYVLFGIALILGLMAGMFKWAIDQDKSPFPAKSFIISIVVVLGLLGPNSLVDVTVISKRDNSYQNISNVPLLPALSGWLITGTITVIADQFAQAFSVVGVANTWTAFSPIQHFVGLATADFQPACVPIAGSEKDLQYLQNVEPIPK